MKKGKKEIIKIIGIILIILLLAGLSIISGSNIIKRVGQNEKHLEEQPIKTNAYYEIKNAKNDELEILLTIENQKGIEKVIGQDITIEGNGKKKLALDRILKEGQEYQFRLKLLGEEEEELHTLVASYKPSIQITNQDTYGDGNTKTVEIHYANNENLIHYYSLDNGENWEIYNGPITMSIADKYRLTAKSLWKEGNTVFNTEIYYTLILGDSILTATQDCVDKNGYYRIVSNNKEYYAHAYVNKGDMVLEENATYGDSIDVGTANTNAKHMVILKVDGNLTINPGVTLTSYGTKYGGPKGMLVCTTGELTNNGTITMTARGAKAAGEDVYLWKNASDSSYEYVPTVGATGGAGFSIYRDWGDGARQSNGNKGNDGTNRETGGGGSGAGRAWYRSITVGNGGTGTSYSGGAGSGAANEDGYQGWSVTSGAGSSVGGAGSNGVVGSSNSSGYGQISMGGVGNPSGGYSNYRVSPVNYVERNGTGGLLIIDANTFNNTGTISTEGVSSSTANRSYGNARIDTGGASGGGSLNIFYRNVRSKGTLSAIGGKALYGEGGNAGGAGGNGTISIGKIIEGTYEPVTDNQTISLTAENATITGEETVKTFSPYTATISPNEGYNITNIIVKMGERYLELGNDYTYENGTLNINIITENVEIKVETTKLTGANYGQEVIYEAKGVSKWKIFYNDPITKEIFIIASDYLENSKIPENAGMTNLNTYQAYFENIPEYTEIPDETRNRFLMKWNNSKTSKSIKCVSKLLDTTVWSEFATKPNSYAIGSPTIEMWMKSWNAVYPDEKLSYSSNGSNDGYYINVGEETQENTIINYDQIGKMQGYNNTLYYPHKRRI